MTTDTTTLALAAVIRAIRQTQPEMSEAIERELLAVKNAPVKADWAFANPLDKLIAAAREP